MNINKVFEKVLCKASFHPTPWLNRKLYSFIKAICGLCSFVIWLTLYWEPFYFRDQAITDLRGLNSTGALWMLGWSSARSDWQRDRSGGFAWWALPKWNISPYCDCHQGRKVSENWVSQWGVLCVRHSCLSH